MSSVTVISDSEFQTTVLENSADQPVLVYFWAPWCGPCRLMSGIIEKVATTYSDRLKVVKIEVDPNPNTVKTYQVEGVPALRLIKAGELLAAQEGLITQAKVDEFLAPELG